MDQIQKKERPSFPVPGTHSRSWEAAAVTRSCVATNIFLTGALPAQAVRVQNRGLQSVPASGSPDVMGHLLHARLFHTHPLF